MVRFYDPRDEEDLARVEKLLREGGIEYFTSTVRSEGGYPVEILVAEEDLPQAEALLMRSIERK
ncbi:DUF2007 domain-containing protein [Geomonas sp. RF6]|uniref:putative signal transducing protein n=1 Tax=Geomonas sp. RF6 TaxID=2897342 RepID=UPI001E346473|nr:DUF2007 domain-containing protein [Geomonas sp. RF6]UFS69527.1 DUF2007 domain-containing protein [Geomonas sp. RF6]